MPHADRGYPSLEYFERVIDAGGYFLMRAKSDFNPKLVYVGGPGGRLARFEGYQEWKSFANLHEFASANPALVEGLIWASLCAAAIKRSLAHASHRIGRRVAISTQVTAMCGVHILRDLLRCALEGFNDLEIVLEEIVRFLKDNASRAHPQRDRLKGRLRFVLEYVGVSA